MLHSLTRTSSSTNSGSFATARLAHRGEVLADARSSSGIRFSNDLVDEFLPCVCALEVATAAKEQRLLEPPLHGAIARFDVAVLLLRADRRRPRRHPEVLHHRDVLDIERSLAVLDNDAMSVGDPMRRRRRIVGLVIARHAAELEQRALHALAKSRHRLRQADRRPLPIRVRQHQHAQQVHEQLAGDRHCQLACAREVGLRCFAGAVVLCERDLARRAGGSAPPLHATLQRTQLAGLVPVRMLILQQLEQRLGLELRRLPQALLDLRPVRLKRVQPRPPVTRSRRDLRRHNAAFDVLASGLSVHVRFHRGPTNPPVLAHLFHQLPHLSVAHWSHGPASTSWRTRPSDPRSRRRKWGDVIVVVGEI